VNVGTTSILFFFVEGFSDPKMPFQVKETSEMKRALDFFIGEHLIITKF